MTSGRIKHYEECPAFKDADATCTCNEIEDKQVAEATRQYRHLTSPADLIRKAKAQGLLAPGQAYH